MIKFEERDDIEIVCVNCKKEIDTIFYKSYHTMSSRITIYFCPYCKHPIPVSITKDSNYI